ncbi:MAG: hypothetical protein ACFCUU_18450, partial [Cyclobacteriaceae bacterium]
MKTLFTPIGQQETLKILLINLFLVGMMVFHSCRENVVDPMYRPLETVLLTGTIWRLESARFHEMIFNLVNNDISDTARVTKFEYDANFDSDLPIHISYTYRLPGEGNELIPATGNNIPFYTDIRFFSPKNEITDAILYNDGSCNTDGIHSWSWLQSTLPLIRVTNFSSTVPIFKASSFALLNAAYTISSLTENELVLGLREDVPHNFQLRRYFEELRFVAVNTGICDIDLNVSAIEPASGLP